MDITTKDIVLILIGFMGSVGASGVWHWWHMRSRRSREAARLESEKWRERLNHQGYLPRSEAAMEIIIRSLYWFVIGNVFFGLQGMSVVFSFASGVPLQEAFYFITSIGVVVSLTNSLVWLRKFLRLKTVRASDAAAYDEDEGTNS